MTCAFVTDLKNEDRYYPRNRLFQYILNQNEWVYVDLAQYVTALCVGESKDWIGEAVVSLSFQGDVFFKTSELERHEIIKYADPHDGTETHFLGGNGLSQIGNSFFACGSGGQLCRRDMSGNWVLLTPHFIPNYAEIGRLSDEAEERGDLEGAINMWDSDSRTSFFSVNGITESEVYVTGFEGGLLYWDGQKTRWIDGIPKETLAATYVEKGYVWVSGGGGTVNHGNYQNGFEDYSLGSDFFFSAITRFGGLIYLCSSGEFGGPVGLFTYDGHRLEQVSCGLTPDIHDIHTVTAADGILWAVGYRDILCFDGKTWQRIDHPDNPPVR
jgi:hypothetical protein